jgi:hypothetical protein
MLWMLYRPVCWKAIDRCDSRLTVIELSSSSLIVIAVSFVAPPSLCLTIELGLITAIGCHEVSDSGATRRERDIRAAARRDRGQMIEEQVRTERESRLVAASGDARVVGDPMECDFS